MSQRTTLPRTPCYKHQMFNLFNYSSPYFHLWNISERSGISTEVQSWSWSCSGLCHCACCLVLPALPCLELFSQPTASEAWKWNCPARLLLLPVTNEWRHLRGHWLWRACCIFTLPFFLTQVRRSTDQEQGWKLHCVTRLCVINNLLCLRLY
jgi:hypothetical protein